MTDRHSSDMTPSLTGRMPIETFDREIRERRFQRFEAAIEQDEIKSLFNLARLENLLKNESLINYVDVYADGHLKRLADMQHKSGMSGLDMAAHCFRGGHTLRMRDIDRFDQTLSGFISDVQHRFAARAQANLYLTPPRAAGFPPHFDITDVFVVQLLGEKNWKLFADYSNRIELPLPSVDWEPERFQPTDDYEAFTLRPGDVLYIPRGVMHAAVCTERESMHLTIGIVPVTYADILYEAVRLAADSDVELRRRVPLSAGARDDALPAIARTAHDRLLSATGHNDLLELLRRERDAMTFTGEARSGRELESVIADLLSATRSRVSVSGPSGN